MRAELLVSGWYAGSVRDQTGFWGAVVANGGVVVDNQSVADDAYS